MELIDEESGEWRGYWQSLMALRPSTGAVEAAAAVYEIRAALACAGAGEWEPSWAPADSVALALSDTIQVTLT